MVRLDREAERLEARQRSDWVYGAPAVLEEDVEPGREVAAGGDARVDLAQRAGAAVARVGVERQALLLALGVDARELRLGHVDLAAHLERRPARDSSCGMAAMVRRLAVTSSPVRPSPRVAPSDEAAGLVAKADGQAVDLELGDVARSGRLGRRGQAQAAAHAGVEGAQLVGVEGVGQARASVSGAGPRRAVADGAPPTRCVGESGVTSSGWSASSSTSSRKSASYSASLISGASCSW